MTDLLAEFVTAAMAASVEDYEALIERGVPMRFLWSGACRFGVADIVVDDDAGLFQPFPGGTPAYIVPDRPLGDEEPALGDLIAWRLDEPGRWWLRGGFGRIINPDAILRAEIYHTPLTVWRSPLSWMRAGGSGIVIVSSDINLPFYLAGAAEIVTEDLELGEEIERRLCAPYRAPRILVRKAA